MNDQFSAATGTLAFVTAALPVAQGACKSIEDMEKAGPEIGSLASQMTELTEVLGKLQQLADNIITSPDDTGRRVVLSPALFKDCIWELQNVQLIVTTINAGLTKGQMRRFFSKMTWFLKDKRQVSRCTSSIAAQTYSLSLVSAVLQR